MKFNFKFTHKLTFYPIIPSIKIRIKIDLQQGSEFQGAWGRHSHFYEKTGSRSKIEVVCAPKPSSKAASFKVREALLPFFPERIDFQFAPEKVGVATHS